MPKDKLIIKTPVFRVSYPALFEAKVNQKYGGEPKFEVTMIWSKESIALNSLLPEAERLNFAEFRKKIEEFAASVVGKKSQASSFKWPFKDGAEKVNDKGEPSPGYGPGTFSACARSQRRPNVRNQKSEAIFSDEIGPDGIYPGCFARAEVVAYFSSYGSDRVILGLNAVQKVADGEPLGGGRSSEFTPIAEPDDASSLGDEF